MEEKYIQDRLAQFRKFSDWVRVQRRQNRFQGDDFLEHCVREQNGLWSEFPVVCYYLTRHMFSEKAFRKFIKRRKLKKDSCKKKPRKWLCRRRAEYARYLFAELDRSLSKKKLEKIQKSTQDELSAFDSRFESMTKNIEQVTKERERERKLSNLREALEKLSEGPGSERINEILADIKKKTI